jgi:hypothetical protein
MAICNHRNKRQRENNSIWRRRWLGLLMAASINGVTKWRRNQYQ